MFLIVKEQYSVCHILSAITIYLYSMQMAWKYTVYHVNESNIGHTFLKQKLKKNT